MTEHLTDAQIEARVLMLIRLRPRYHSTRRLWKFLYHPAYWATWRMWRKRILRVTWLLGWEVKP